MATTVTELLMHTIRLGLILLSLGKLPQAMLWLANEAIHAQPKMINLGKFNRALAYLIGMQRLDEVPPLDIEEIHWGVGRLLEKTSRRLRRIANDLEAQEMRKDS